MNIHPGLAAAAVLAFADRVIRPALFLLSAACAAAHPEIEGALARINAALAVNPADASLFLQRGQLHTRHGDLVSAEANLLRAAELNPAEPGLERTRGELALIQGDPATAIGHLDRAIAADRADADARVLRARARRATGQRESAAADLDQAFELLGRPDPALLLERAALAADPAGELAVLEAGGAVIGPVPALEQRALNLERRLGRTEAALARLDRLAAASERPELWLRLRGDVLREAGRPTEAGASYRAALAAIQRLPGWLRDSPATRLLHDELLFLSSSS